MNRSLPQPTIRSQFHFHRRAVRHEQQRLQLERQHPFLWSDLILLYGTRLSQERYDALLDLNESQRLDRPERQERQLKDFPDKFASP